MIKVSLYSSRCSFPFQFSAHHWFVIDRDGKLSRWEVLHLNDRQKSGWGHLYEDFFAATEGLGRFGLLGKNRWPSRLIAQTEGDEASRMADFIENSPQTYPYCHSYSFLGPNSNTFVQWILNEFPEFHATLPTNSIGKKYKVVL